MDRDDLELFERSLRQATEAHTGDALDRALVDLGWPDALADEPQAAVSMLFALQGEANATSSALDHVLAHGLGVGAGAPPAVLLPALGSVVPPGRLDDGGRPWWTGSGRRASADADAVARRRPQRRQGRRRPRVRPVISRGERSAASTRGSGSCR